MSASLSTHRSALLFAEAHDDEGDDQAIECDGFYQREPDPHILRDASFCFGLARHHFNHLPKDIADPHTGPGKPCRVKKAERRRIDAFELWCWRRLLRVPWTARRSSQSILKEIS